RDRATSGQPPVVEQDPPSVQRERTPIHLGEEDHVEELRAPDQVSEEREGPERGDRREGGEEAAARGSGGSEDGEERREPRGSQESSNDRSQLLRTGTQDDRDQHGHRRDRVGRPVDLTRDQREVDRREREKE